MIRITCLLYDGFTLLDVAGPATVFEVAGTMGVGEYSVEAVAKIAGPVRSSSGLSLAAIDARASAGFDTLFIPGGLGAVDPANYQPLLPTIKRAAKDGRRIVSLSSGAFILGEAGLLRGRKVVTHWALASRLADRYPRMDVDGATLFAYEGNIWTSAGIIAGVDLALALVEQDYGAAGAAKIAETLLLPYRRPATGRQQHPAMPNTDRPVSRFSDVMAWARDHLDEALPIERLADRAALSVRQFTRAFKDTTGMPAAKFVERLRIERARSLVEAGMGSMEEIARVSGFQTAERMRRAFVRNSGRTPREMRRALARQQ